KTGCIVARTEGRRDQPYRVDRESVATHRQTVGRDEGFTLELVRSQVFFSLLLSEYAQNGLNGLFPLRIERRFVVGFLVIVIGQADGVTEGVYFPFALVNARKHFGAVVYPVAFLILIVIEGVGIGIFQDQLGLMVDNPFD